MGCVRPYIPHSSQLNTCIIIYNLYPSLFVRIIIPCSVCVCVGNLYGRKVLIIPVDFTDGQQIYQDIAKQLAGLDIGILGRYGITSYFWLCGMQVSCIVMLIKPLVNIVD